MKVVAIILFFIAAFYSAPPAYSQEDYANANPTQDLGRLKKYGPEKLRARFQPDRTLWLEGLRNGKLVWKKRFPIDGPINDAKTTIESSANTIKVISEQPWSAMQYIYRFSWNGQRLVYLGRKSYDPTEENIAKAETAALNGDRALAMACVENAAAYTDRYVNDSLITDLLSRGHEKALAIYRSNGPKPAADRLKLVFDTTVALIEMRGNQIESTDAPAKWIEAWKSDGIDLYYDCYCDALTDYGYFLQRLGNDRAALPFLKAAVDQSEVYCVGSLNYADSLWKVGHLKEAKENYKIYIEYMKQTEDEARIPARVFQRTGIAVLKPKVKVASAVAKVGNAKQAPQTSTKDKSNTSKGSTGSNSNVAAKLPPDYLSDAVSVPSLRWPKSRMPIRIFIKKCPETIGFRDEYISVLKNAFLAWSEASQGLVTLAFVPTEKEANVVCEWKNTSAKYADSDREAGQAQVEPDASGIKSGEILLKGSPGNGLFSNDQMRRLCLHEVGHVLGLSGHSSEDVDVMYEEPNLDSSTGLSARDTTTLRKLYSNTTPIDLTTFLKADEVNKRGIERMNEGDLDGALRLFEQSVTADENHSAAKQNLGSACYSKACQLMKKDDLTGAKGCFEKAITYNKDGYKRSLYASTLKQYAVLLRRLGKNQEADGCEAEAFGITSGLLH